MAFSLALPPLVGHLQIPLILVLNVFSLTQVRSHPLLTPLLSFPPLILLVSQSLYREWDRGWGLHYGINCFVMTLVFGWVEWVVLARPDGEGWVKVRRGEKKLGKKKEGEREKRWGKEGKEGRWVRDGVGEKLGAVKQKDGGVVKTKEKVPEGFLERFWWALRLATTNRYVGWSCEAKNVPLEVGFEYPRL